MVYDSLLQRLPEIDPSLVEERTDPGRPIYDRFRRLGKRLTLVEIAEITYGYRGCHEGRYHHGVLGRIGDALVVVANWEPIQEEGSEVIIRQFLHGKDVDFDRTFIVVYRTLDRFDAKGNLLWKR